MEEKRGDPSEAAIQKEQLRLETLHKIDAFQEQGICEDTDFYYLVKNFFRQYLGANYEFTINELRTELKKIYLNEPTRQELNEILDHISLVECVSEKGSSRETGEHLEAFRQIVDTLLPEQGNTVIRNFWQRLSLAMHTLFQHSRRQSPSILSVEQLIAQLKQEIQSKSFEPARKTYQQLMAIYNSLQETEKARYYQQINELYTTLSNS